MGFLRSDPVPPGVATATHSGRSTERAEHGCTGGQTGLSRCWESMNSIDHGLFFFYFILEKPATRPRDRCGKEQLVYPFVTGSPGSSRVSALAPYSSGDRVGSTLSTPHAGGDLGLFVGECSSPQTDAPNDDERVRLMSLTPPP